MERIEQKIAEPITIVPRNKLIYIEQNVDEEWKTDVIQVEKQSIPSLIAALQKYLPHCSKELDHDQVSIVITSHMFEQEAHPVQTIVDTQPQPPGTAPDIDIDTVRPWGFPPL